MLKYATYTQVDTEHLGMPTALNYGNTMWAPKQGRGLSRFGLVAVITCAARGLSTASSETIAPRPAHR
jgi:hypothetical protein